MAPTQVRTTLRDAANEAHVRTGGKAVVLTLVYVEGASQAPAQAIAYGKPAVAFAEARKELITGFEAACREHFKGQQAAAPASQTQQQRQGQAQSAQQPCVTLLPFLQLGAAAAAAAAGSSAAAGGGGGTTAAAAAPSLAGAAAHRPCPLGPTSQLLTAANLAPGAQSLPPTVNVGPATPSGAPPPLLPPPGALLPVDLESVIASTVADPAAAISRCREARVSGEVLARLPQAMQLTVLMQAGLLAGEAASVVVELEARMRLLQLPALSLAALAQQVMQQAQAPAAAAPSQLQQPPTQHVVAQLPAAPQLFQPEPAQPAAHVQQHLLPVTGLGLAQGQGGGAGGSSGGASVVVPGMMSACVAGGAPPCGFATGPPPVEALQRSLGPLQAVLATAATIGNGGTCEGVPVPMPGAGHGALQLQGLLAAAAQAGGGVPELGALGLGVAQAPDQVQL